MVHDDPECTYALGIKIENGVYRRSFLRVRTNPMESVEHPLLAELYEKVFDQATFGNHDDVAGVWPKFDVYVRFHDINSPMITAKSAIVSECRQCF